MTLYIDNGSAMDRKWSGDESGKETNKEKRIKGTIKTHKGLYSDVHDANEMRMRMTSR